MFLIISQAIPKYRQPIVLRYNNPEKKLNLKVIILNANTITPQPTILINISIF